MEFSSYQSDPKPDRPRWLAPVMIIIAGLLAFAIGAGVSFLLLNRSPQSSKGSDQPAAKSSQTASTQKSATCSGKTYTNKSFNYQACYPAEWQTVEFDKSLALVGFNPTKLDPDGQEFGILHITVVERPAAEVISELENSLDQVTTAGFDIDNLSGTLVSGLNKSEQKIHPNYPERDLVIARTSNQTIVATFVAKPEEFKIYLSFWQDLIDNFKIEV